MPLDIDTAMCDSLTSPAWALDSSEPMLFDMPVAVTPRDGMGGGLQTSMSWGYPAHTAQAAEPLAFLSEVPLYSCCPRDSCYSYNQADKRRLGFVTIFAHTESLCTACCGAE
jgi:hypothetical protein